MEAATPGCWRAGGAAPARQAFGGDDVAGGRCSGADGDGVVEHGDGRALSACDGPDRRDVAARMGDLLWLRDATEMLRAAVSQAAPTVPIERQLATMMACRQADRIEATLAGGRPAVSRSFTPSQSG